MCIVMEEMENLTSILGSVFPLAYPVEPITEWIQITWRSFFFDATLEEVKTTYDSFDPVRMSFAFSLYMKWGFPGCVVIVSTVIKDVVVLDVVNFISEGVQLE